MTRIMLGFLGLLVVLLPGCGPLTQQPSLPEADRIRIAEVINLAGALQDKVWKGWGDAPFALLLVTDVKEFLMMHPSPSKDFTPIGYDSMVRDTVYVRDRVFQPSVRAMFPAVGGVPTIVIGQAEATGLSSTYWVIVVLHEHFHQLQNSQPDYYQAVDSLDLASGDKTGMWMLNYPFPYDSTNVGDHFSRLCVSLLNTLQAIDTPGFEDHVSKYLVERQKLRTVLREDDYKYFSFQVWQEGVARYTEYKIARAAADGYSPSEEFRSLSDFVTFDAAADSIYRAIEVGLAQCSLAEDRRVAFYPFGAAEALVLDRACPDWQDHYFSKKFYLEHRYE